jgi:hypothetical protein
MPKENTKYTPYFQCARFSLKRAAIKAGKLVDISRSEFERDATRREPTCKLAIRSSPHNEESNFFRVGMDTPRKLAPQVVHIRCRRSSGQEDLSWNNTGEE